MATLPAKIALLIGCTLTTLAFQLSGRVVLAEDEQKPTPPAEATGSHAIGTSEAADASKKLPIMKSQDYLPYMNAVQKSIKEHWYPPKHEKPLSTVLFFHITTDGTVKDLRIKKSSGVEIYDLAALEAVERCGKFGILPDPSVDEIQIEFSLDYNMQSSKKDTLTPAEQIDNLWKGAIQGELVKLKKEVKN